MEVFIKCLLFCTAILSAHGKTGCIGEDGKPVDMFMIYKLPKLTEEADVPFLEDGGAYAYMDSNNLKFRFGSKSITDEKNPVGLTLNQVYDRYKLNLNNNTGSLAHVFYNDQEPEGMSHGSNGHTKGAVAFDLKSGFWLIHSVPRFPANARDGYMYPETGLRYGQSMMCITFDYDQFEKIGNQLIFNHPHIHDSFLPKSFIVKFPNIRKLLKRARPKKTPFSSAVDLKSSGGIEFRHFAKYTRFHKDLYHDFVARDLQTDLITETWQHGTNIGPSCDGDYHVEDVSDLKMDISTESVSFRTMQDHSKFAIGKTSSMPYVCVGDINRQPSQFKRGGGTMCIKNFDIWNQYYNLVKSYIGCS